MIVQQHFKPTEQGDLCGSYEAQIKIYKKLEDSHGHVWLVPVNDREPGAGVHYHNPRDLGSDGYAGRTLVFKLEDGTEYHAKGPWHSNSGALYSATGYDVRDKILTQVVVGRKSGRWMELEDVYYIENEPVLGTFDRYKTIGQEWADKLGHPVRVYMKSTGGSSNSPFIPTGWTRDQEMEYWKTLK